MALKEVCDVFGTTKHLHKVRLTLTIEPCQEEALTATEPEVIEKSGLLSDRALDRLGRKLASGLTPPVKTKKTKTPA